MPNVATVLVDQNRLFRNGLTALLSDAGFEVVGECAGAQEAATLGQGAAPGLVLHGPAAGSDARLVILTDAQAGGAMLAGIRAGADGCLVKDISPDALVQSLRLVMMGEKVLPTQLAAMLVAGRFVDEPLAPTTGKGLSPREVEILRCLVHGESNKVIANRLGIMEPTVKVHLKGLLRKVGASNRTQAAIWALNNGLGEAERDAVAAVA